MIDFANQQKCWPITTWSHDMFKFWLRVTPGVNPRGPTNLPRKGPTHPVPLGVPSSTFWWPLLSLTSPSHLPLCCVSLWPSPLPTVTVATPTVDGFLKGRACPSHNPSCHWNQRPQQTGAQASDTCVSQPPPHSPQTAHASSSGATWQTPVSFQHPRSHFQSTRQRPARMVGMLPQVHLPPLRTSPAGGPASQLLGLTWGPHGKCPLCHLVASMAAPSATFCAHLCKA